MNASNTAEVLTGGRFEALKAKQQATWGSGDYAAVGTTLQIVGEQLCEAIDLRCGSTVLDVAAGNGNATLAAARRFCDVTSTDYVESLLERGRQRAEAEALAVNFEVADAEALPYANESFDVVLSTFGVMFAPDQELAAAELMRVCRSGGTVATSNWTPASFIGRVFGVIGRYLPPPQGVRAPSRWGDETGIRELFGDADITIIPRHFVFRYRSTTHFIEYFREFYGPIHKAFQALGELQAAALEADLRALLDELNVANDGTLVLPSEYVDVIVRKA